MSIVNTHLKLVDNHRSHETAKGPHVQPDAPAARELAPYPSDSLSAEARRLRAEAVRELASMIGRGIARAVRRLAGAAASSLLAIGEALAARRTYEELSRLSDHELADIGLRREDIAAVAWRLAQQRPEAPDTPAKVSQGAVEQEVREAA